MSAFAQGTGFSSTDLKTGISNSLAVIIMFGFVLGISSVIYGGFAIRRGDVDKGKMSIIGGAILRRSSIWNVRAPSLNTTNAAAPKPSLAV